ncbi:MAG: efflux transporter outer membrane subunit [Methylomonas sp.]
MTRFRPVGLLAALCLMGGCAWFGEDSERAEMASMPQMGRTLAEARASLPVSDGWPETNWWTVFKDQTLNRLIEAALADSPDLKTAAARLRQSQAMVDSQAAELYPTVEANISFSAQRFSANSTQAKLAGEHFRQMLINPLVLRYHLDFWGRDQAALEGAVGRSLAVQAELADARLLLASAVARAYFDLVAAEEKRRIAEQLAAYRENLFKLQQRRLDAGLIAAAPLLQFKMALNVARQTVEATRAEVELQKNLLAALAGKGPDWGRDIAVTQGIFPGSLNLPADLPLRLLAHRPDLGAARLNAQAAAQEIKVAETAFYPDVNLVGFAGLHSVSITDVLLQGSSLAYSVGPSIEFPIFEGGRLRANLSYQQATYDAAVERYNASLIHAVQDVADALSRWREIEARLAEQQQNVSDAAETGRLADSLNRTGLNDKVDLIQASLEEYQQRLRLATLQGEHFKAAVHVIQALGGGYAEAETKSQ